MNTQAVAGFQANTRLSTVDITPQDSAVSSLFQRSVRMIASIAKKFEEGGQKLFEREKDLREQLATSGQGSGTTNPKLLAEYQAAVSEINILRNAQSSTVKAFKDTDAAIVANFR